MKAHEHYRRGRALLARSETAPQPRKELLVLQAIAHGLLGQLMLTAMREIDDPQDFAEWREARRE